MDNFIVSARKYRPRVFDDVVGQQAIANTLKRAIANNKLAGAYLFCGPRGVGKTTCARIFAKAINCLNPHENGESCNECESCKSFDEGRSVNVQELNAAANNSVDDIRAIIDQVRIPPQLGKYKVIILDEVHMLSQAASNALLKTLEEPPSYVIFVLATTEKQKILSTILSRCQIFDFNRMEVDNIIRQLKTVAENEGIEYEDAALNVIAQKADGGMRDSLSIFDQVASFSAGKITYESVLRCLNVLDYDYYFKMTDMLLAHEVSNAMLMFNEVITKGFDGGVFIAGLASHLRDLLVSQHPETTGLLDVSQEIRARYSEQAQKCSAPFLYKAIRKCDRCANEYKYSCNKRLSVEITLIEVSQIGTPNETADEGVGRGPAKILKPLFKETNQGLSQAQQTKPAQVSSPSKPEVKTSGSANITSSSAPVASPPAEIQPQKVVKRGGMDKAAILKAMNSVSIGSLLSGNSATPTQAASIQPSEKPTPVVSEPQATFVSETENESFTDAQLTTIWMAYTNTLSREHSDIQGRMLGMKPKQGDNAQVNIEITNESIIGIMKPLVPQIEDYLRKHLHNSNVSLNFIVKELKVVKAVTPSKVFDDMQKDNPAFQMLCKELALQIE